MIWVVMKNTLMKRQFLCFCLRADHLFSSRVSTQDMGHLMKVLYHN